MSPVLERKLNHFNWEVTKKHREVLVVTMTCRGTSSVPLAMVNAVPVVMPVLVVATICVELAAAGASEILIGRIETS